MPSIHKKNWQSFHCLGHIADCCAAKESLSVCGAEAPGRMADHIALACLSAAARVGVSKANVTTTAQQY